VLMGPELDANYERVKADVWEWYSAGDGVQRPLTSDMAVMQTAHSGVRATGCLAWIASAIRPGRQGLKGSSAGSGPAPAGGVRKRGSGAAGA